MPASPLSVSRLPGKLGRIAVYCAAVVLPWGLAERAAAAEPVWLENEEIRESSGLAASTRRDGVFWTHNDSGDRARLFAFDHRGRHLAEVRLRGAEAVDWEDLASYRIDGQSRLLVADVGDNARRRDEVVLYEIAEPDAAGAGEAEVLRRWRVRYPEGPTDCEAVAVDVPRREILLIAKTLGVAARIYTVGLDGAEAEPVEPRAIGSIHVPLVTAADIDPQGAQLVVLTYGDAFVFTRRADRSDRWPSWASVLDEVPRHVPLPARRQGEAVGFDAGGESLWLTSEKVPTPLWRVEHGTRNMEQGRGSEEGTTNETNRHE